MGDEGGRLPGPGAPSDGRPVPVTAERTRLKASIEELIARASELREGLLQYEHSMAEIGRGLDEGEAALRASEGTSIPSDRRRVSEAITQFEEARHQLRVALIDAGRAEGASVAEVATVLGISRQLAYRLAARR